MPKQRSSYYSFRHFFCEEQKKRGVFYANKKELDKEAYPAWMDTPPAMRLVIKKLVSGLITKEELREEGKAKVAERAAIKNFVHSGIPNDRILDEVINLIDVNYYCVTSAGKYLIGECSVVRFSLREGVLGHYHIHVRPGKIPMGYQNDVKQGCKNFGLIPLDEDADLNDWSVLNDIKTFVRFTNSSVLFTIPDKVPAVLDFICEITSKAGEDPSQFSVYKVDYLFYTLNKSIMLGSDIFSRVVALEKLQQKKFICYPGLRCEHHYIIDNHKCTTARATNWAFTILEACCPAAGIDVQRGKHLPYEFEDNLESLGVFRMDRKEESFEDTDRASTEPSTSFSSAKKTYGYDSKNNDESSEITKQLQEVTLNK